ncbi:hsp70-binding protein 1 [Epargyreus clarus]|uniref:hsp70-binding protein 1 n=1 Tax=Epargyreus clarus TaxID=520877 RepID=UPI003C2D27F0
MASNPNPGSSGSVAGAIAYPASSDNLQPVADQPRQPRTLQGLLRFAMEATKAEDAPGNSDLGPMDEERRRFLDNALNSHTIRIDEILRKNIAVLTDDKISSIVADHPLPDDVLCAFRELGEYIDDIDVANDFDKMGGFRIFPLCHSSNNIELRRWSNLTLALVCQNNPHCQDRALRCGLMPLLLQEQQADDKKWRAVSSMIRNYEPGTRAFICQGGCELLASALQGSGTAELPGVAFLLAYLCRTNADARDVLIKSNIIQIVVEALKAGRTESSEHMLNILVSLIESKHPGVAAIYRDPALGLQKTLEEHLKIQDVSNGRFIEEKEHCERILQLMVESKSEMNGSVETQDVEPADR